MLAALFLLIFGAIHGLFFFAEFGDLLRNAAQPPLDVVIDFAVASLVLSAIIRFLYRVGRFNWSISRKQSDADTYVG